jgi:hypothetical protein
MSNVISLEDRIVERDCRNVFIPGDSLRVDLDGVDISAFNFIYECLHDGKKSEKKFTDKFITLLELYSFLLSFNGCNNDKKKKLISGLNNKIDFNEKKISLDLTLNSLLSETYNYLLNNYCLSSKESSSFLIEYMKYSFLMEFNTIGSIEKISTLIENCKNSNMTYLNQLKKIHHELKDGRYFLFMSSNDLDSYSIGFVDYIIF